MTRPETASAPPPNGPQHGQNGSNGLNGWGRLIGFVFFLPLVYCLLGVKLRYRGTQLGSPLCPGTP